MHLTNRNEGFSKAESMTTRNTGIIIVGGGVTGLTVAYRLISSGVPGKAITILEEKPYLGGMASSFRSGNARIDRYYHFICKQDVQFLRLISEIGLADRVSWKPSRMAYYDQGRLLSFCSIGDLLRFPGVDLATKLRYGALVAGVRLSRHWGDLEYITARDWLQRRIGKAGYEFFWKELIHRKFGDFDQGISAAWVWARIRRNVTSRRGLSSDYIAYLKGGTQVFLDAMAGILEKAGVEIRLDTRVSQILTSRDGAVDGVTDAEGVSIPASVIVCTAPLITLNTICERLSSTSYGTGLAKMNNIGLICTVLELARPLTGFFWTNITDKETPQTGVIEFTALAPDHHPDGKTIIYMPEYRELTDTDIREIDTDNVVSSYYPLLEKLNHRFEPEWITGSHVFTERYAQPICPVGFTSLVPGFETGISGLWAVDHTQLLPDDRTISGCIGLAGRLAHRIQSG